MTEIPTNVQLPAEKSDRNQVKLDVIAKTLKPEQVEKKLAAAYDTALKAVQASLTKEAAGYTKELKLAAKENDLQKVAQLVRDAPDWIPVKWNIKFSPTGGPKAEIEKTVALLKKVDISDSVVSLLRIKEIVDDAKAAGVQISVAFTELSAKPSQKYMKTLQEEKTAFVITNRETIMNGLKGDNVAEYKIDMKAPRLADAFAESLEKTVGLKRPEDAEEGKYVAFKEAKLPQNSYPLEVKKDESTVMVQWASWIARGATRADMGAAIQKIVPSKFANALKIKNPFKKNQNA